MKTNHLGGFKNLNAPTIIEITVVETHVMVKMVIKIYFGMKFEQLVICHTIKRCTFSYLISDAIINPY